VRTPWLLRLVSIWKPSARRSLGLAVPARSEANSAGSVEFGLGALVAAEFLTSLDGDRCFRKEVEKSYESLSEDKPATLEDEIKAWGADFVKELLV
jgi:hypothetical protein